MKLKIVSVLFSLGFVFVVFEQAVYTVIGEGGDDFCHVVERMFLRRVEPALKHRKHARNDEVEHDVERCFVKDGIFGNDLFGT